MPGVAAKPDVRDLEQSADLLGRLDDRADVRVQGHGDSGLRSDPLQDDKRFTEGFPVGLQQALAPVVVGGFRRCGKQENPPPKRRDRGRRRPHFRDRGGQAVGAVEDDRHEGTHDEPLRREHSRGILRASWQKARRSELGGPDADLARLSQHALGRHLVAPSGHLADSPGDWKLLEPDRIAVQRGKGVETWGGRLP